MLWLAETAPSGTERVLKEWSGYKQEVLVDQPRNHLALGQ